MRIQREGMPVVKTDLVNGERQLGRYMGVILRQHDGDWVPVVRHLDTIVTNYRLMLRPLQKRYTPASIPSSYFQQVQMQQRGPHDCLLLHLTTGQVLVFMVSTGRLADLYDDLNAMRAKPTRIHFDERVVRADVERLIGFLDSPV